MAIILILGLTMQNTNQNIECSEICRKYTVRIADNLGINTDNTWWNTPAHFRKVGHTIEYFCLGIGIYFAIRNPLMGLIICVFVSFIDQYIKIYVPMRHFDITDIPFDFVGGISGIIVCWGLFEILKGRNKNGK